MTLPRYDFTQPPPLPPQLRANIAQWLTRSNALLMELLATAAVSLACKYESTSRILPTALAADWTDKSFAIQVKIGEHDAESLIAMPNPLTQELISNVLGDVPHKPPVERVLTPAELSIAEVVADMIVRSLKESWQGESPLDLKLGEIEPNLRRTKRFRPKEPFVACRSIAKTKLGESPWCWLVSDDFLAHAFGLPMRAQPSTDPAATRRQLEMLVRDMHADVEVRLGSVHLTGPELAALRVGDVVVLNQRVSEPLRGVVRGEPKFLGWAGRVGNRQAFEIAVEILPRHADDQPGVA